MDSRPHSKPFAHSTGVGDWRGTGQTKVAMRHGDTRCVHGPKHHLRVHGVGGSWLLSLVILNPGWSEGPMWALDGSPVACYSFFFGKVENSASILDG